MNISIESSSIGIYARNKDSSLPFLRRTNCVIRDTLIGMGEANRNPVTNLTSVTATASDLLCELGTSGDAIEEYAASNSGLQNLRDDYYQWNWKPPTAMPTPEDTQREPWRYSIYSVFKFK